MDRAEALHARTLAYLARVDGPDNVTTRAALAELRERCARGVTLPENGLEDELLRLMAEVHPRKADETGEAALRRLVAGALAHGRGRDGFRAPRPLGLVAVLMFAFGHRFDADPFLPWIARTLERAPADAPEAIARRLERRALTWLDAVLRNADAQDREEV
jgi:hypothetical protein